MKSDHALETKVIIWLLLAGSVLLVAGCRSHEVSAPATSVPSLKVASAVVVDTSWTADKYIKMGVPDPGRYWTDNDYRDYRDVLLILARTNRAALPRAESPKSGTLFARLVNPTNTAFLGDRFLPTEKRVQHFSGILNRLPMFQSIYRYDATELVFHREVIELNHALLRMLISALEWNGKQLLPSAGEAPDQLATFRLVEYSRSRTEGLLNLPANQSEIPNDDRLLVVGAYTAAALRSLLPWLADGSIQPIAERLRTIRYLREDLPALWPHVRASQQRELLEELGEVLRRTQHGEVRPEMEALRNQLVSK
jgi:hypothetical protein